MSEPMRAVLAATDLGPQSDAVVASAAALAQRLGAELHLVHALEIERLPPLESPSFPDRVAQAEALLAEQARRAAGAVTPASAMVVDQAPGQLIQDRAAAVGAGIIVTGPHHGGEVGAHFLGTTAERVIRMAEVPVLVVRTPLALPVARIGVPVDFSGPARCALDMALPLAGALAAEDGEMIVIHAGWDVEQGEAPVRDRLAADLQRDAAAAVERAGTPAIPVRTEIAWGVSPSETIAKHARDLGIGLLVMGTHGRGGVRRMLMGSVAAGVARQAACPVLLVPPGYGDGDEHEPGGG